MLVRKRFSYRLHKLNDAEAKRIGMRVFGCSPNYDRAIENTQRYGIDLLLVKNNRICGGVECEIKEVWQGDDFPFDTVQFPERKRKYAANNSLFLMINSPKTKALVISGEDLLKSPLVPVPNKYVSNGELFYQVPKDKAVFIDLTNLNARY